MTGILYCGIASNAGVKSHLLAAGAGVGEAEAHDGAQPHIGVRRADVLRQQRKRRVVIILQNVGQNRQEDVDVRDALQFAPMLLGCFANAESYRTASLTAT